MILCIETSTKAFSLSLYEGMEIASVDFLYDITHSQHIVSTVKQILKVIKKKAVDISEIYAGIGPGSFTGVRVGLTFANTMAQVLDIPLLGISTLDLLAFENQSFYNSVIPFIRSRKEEVYTAFYENSKKLTGYIALKKGEFLDFIKGCKAKYLVSSREDYEEIISGEVSEIKAIFSYPKSRNLYLMAQALGLKPIKRYLKPLYVRDV